MRDLGDLTTWRRSHACTKFTADGGDLVMIVTGGFNSLDKYLSTTEMSADLGSSWSPVQWSPVPSTSLPSSRIRASAVNYDNRVFIFGEYQRFLLLNHHMVRFSP